MENHYKTIYEPIDIATECVQFVFVNSSRGAHQWKKLTNRKFHTESLTLSSFALSRRLPLDQGDLETLKHKRQKIDLYEFHIYIWVEIIQKYDTNRKQLFNRSFNCCWSGRSISLSLSALNEAERKP